MGLSNYQLVLLDNLIYLDEITRSHEKDDRIENVVHKLLYKDGDRNNELGTGTIINDCMNCYDSTKENCMMTISEWIEVLRAIEADPVLCSLTIHKVEEWIDNAVGSAVCR